jgi:hypothetical protein
MSKIAHLVGNVPQLRVLVRYHRNVWAATGDRECCAPASSGTIIMEISEKYRSKALACEKLAREVPNRDFRHAWEDIAIEWHALATRRAQEVSREIENKLT